MNTLIVPVGVKPRTSAKLPSWNTKTSAPKVADRLRTLSSNALCETPERWTGDRATEFLRSLDAALSARNIEYEAKRASRRLGAPVLKRVAAGSFTALRQRRVAADAPEAQVKIPHLTTDLRFGDGMDVVEEYRLDLVCGRTGGS